MYIFYCYVPRGGLTAGTGPGDAKTPRRSPVEFPRYTASRIGYTGRIGYIASRVGYIASRIGYTASRIGYIATSCRIYS